MRLAFSHTTPEFERDAIHVFPDAHFKRDKPFLARGGAAYIALGPDHLQEYERRFRGLRIRLEARLRHVPLHPGGAIYLPVTFDSWVVLADGHGAFGAALMAAEALGMGTAVCPAFQLGKDLGIGKPYVRWQDRIVLKDTAVDPPHGIVPRCVGPGGEAHELVGCAVDAGGTPLACDAREPGS
jgi:hypothetical protein